MSEQGRIYTGDEIDRDLTLECDVCVIGSGSGGGWLAHELVGRGLSVILLEEGGYHTARDFDSTEATANGNLYQEMGGRTTEDLAINIMQGRCVGGGTTVNWCSSFRTPPNILQLWADRHGVKGLTAAALLPHFEAIEKRLHIAEWPLELSNRNNRLLWDGLGKLGYQRGLIPRNVHNCANLGVCGLGCPLDAKQSTLVTVIPDAVEKGLTVYANASVRRLETQGRKVTAVHAEVLDPSSDAPTGRKLVVKPRVTSVCGGAINSPALLLRSGLDHGRVGRRTFFHPVVVTVAEFDEPVHGYAGAPQSVYSHQFIERPAGMGFYIEVTPTYPLSAAVSATSFGPQHQAFMERLPFLQANFAGALDGVREGDEGGTVALHPGSARRLKVNYPLTPLHFEAFRTACKEMARIQFAAGARRVVSLHADPVVMDSVDEVDRKLDAAPWEKLRLRVVTGHLMGGCTLGSDPATSVVDSQLKYHGLDNLFVVDGSVFPSGLGVNPQLSIFALARWGSQHVAAAVAGR